MSRAASEYQALVDEFHAEMTRNPNECTLLGVDRGRDRLPDPSLAEAADAASKARALAERARTFERAGLSFDEALDLDLAALVLESRAFDLSYRFNERTTLEQKPTAGDDISTGIFHMFINDPRPDGERLANITARMEAVPGYLDALLARLDRPVARWVDIDLQKVAGLPELFANLCAWAAEVAWADAGRLERAVADAGAALAGYADRLRAMPTTSNLYVGPDIARRLVALRGIELSLDELHAMARDFLAETAAQIESLRRSLAAKYGLDPDIPAERLQHLLGERYAVAPAGTDLELIIDEYRREHARILAFVRERDLFPVPEAQDIKIMRTPGFMAPSIPAGAMESPPPFRDGVRTSLVYLTLSEDLRAEHSRLSIPNMMIHEGIPGHHLQLATASLHPSVIRRHVSAMEHSEGWTTRLEDYMLDLGYMGELTEECRFMAKRDISRIGARVAIDLFFMTGERGFLDVGVDCDISAEDPFTAAGNLLAAVTGFVPGRVQSELDWYSQERAYPLCYLTGNRLVWQLERDLAAASAGRLAGLDLDRTFHELYLETGNMPLSFLRRVFVHEGLLPA